ncbi:MAG: aldo/keto reductase [Alphaproteobacteria bacterium]
MRYRSFGTSGMAISAISLALTDLTQGRQRMDWKGLVFDALENGINAFEIVGQDPAISDGLAAALTSIDRHMVFIAKRLGPTPIHGDDFSALGMTRALEASLARTGLDYFDAVLLNDPAEDALTQEGLEALLAIRERGQTRHIGIAGESKAIDTYISTRKFDVLSMPYSLQSGWISRNRIREACDQNMTIIGYDFLPAVLAAPPEKPLIPKRLFWGGPKSADELKVEAYAFLHEVYGWSAEEIALAYAMTQPALASVQLTTEHAPRLSELAAIAERDMPPGLSPRIEMARFGNGQVAARA